MTMYPAHQKDFYKSGHGPQYPQGTSLVYSNLTARSSRHALVSHLFDDKTVFFGLQGYCLAHLIEDWNHDFFQQPREKVVAAYQRRMDNALGEGVVKADQIGALHDLGYLPLLIKALPEGARVDIKVPYLTVQNTHPGFFWLTNFIETSLSAELWKPITVATIAYEFQRVQRQYAELTGVPLGAIRWLCHDFSMRGMSGIIDAARCGAGHLLSHYGTDTIPAIDYLERYYFADADKEMIGASVPATEHSVMCMGGQADELGTFRRLITELYPSGFVSIVSDTWNFWTVLTEYAPALKDEILARAGRVVFRPDSGDPVLILCGDSRAPVGSPAYKGAVQCLWEVFGGTVNDKGFKTLDEHVSLIYGDGITLSRQHAILNRLAHKGFSSANVVLGIGSYTYQHVTRDTFGMAVKATYGVVNGACRELSKDPATDDGTKKSAVGLLRVEHADGHHVLHDRQTPAQEEEGELLPVFMDSTLLNPQSLAEIRARLGAVE